MDSVKKALVSAIPEELPVWEKGINTLPSGTNVLIQSLGVGNLVASLNLQEIIFQYPCIDEVIFLGSAGSYIPANTQGNIFVSGDSYFYKELSTLNGDSHVPDLLPTRINSEIGEWGKKFLEEKKWMKSDVNSPNSLTKIKIDKDFDFSIDPHKAKIENMEAFGLAYVCSKHKKGFTGLFCLTNDVGPHGSKEWRKNYKTMGKELCGIFSEFLGRV